MNMARISTGFLFALMSAPTLASWTLQGDMCQTSDTSEQVTVQVKQTYLRVVEHIPDCKGRGAAARLPETVIVENTPHQAWAACTDKTDYQTVVVVPDSIDFNAIVKVFRTSASPVGFNVLGHSLQIDTADFNQVCGGLVAKEAPPFDLKSEEDKQERAHMAAFGYHMGNDGLWHRGNTTRRPQSEESKRMNQEFLNDLAEKHRLEQKQAKAWNDSQVIQSPEQLFRIDPEIEARSKEAYKAHRCALKNFADTPECSK